MHMILAMHAVASLALLDVLLHGVLAQESQAELKNVLYSPEHVSSNVLGMMDTGGSGSVLPIGSDASAEAISDSIRDLFGLAEVPMQKNAMPVTVTSQSDVVINSPLANALATLAPTAASTPSLNSVPATSKSATPFGPAKVESDVSVMPAKSAPVQAPSLPRFLPPLSSAPLSGLLPISGLLPVLPHSPVEDASAMLMPELVPPKLSEPAVPLRQATAQPKAEISQKPTLASSAKPLSIKAPAKPKEQLAAPPATVSAAKLHTSPAASPVQATVSAAKLHTSPAASPVQATVSAAKLHTSPIASPVQATVSAAKLHTSPAASPVQATVSAAKLHTSPAASRQLSVSQPSKLRPKKLAAMAKLHTAALSAAVGSHSTSTGHVVVAPIAAAGVKARLDSKPTHKAVGAAILRNRSSMGALPSTSRGRKVSAEVRPIANKPTQGKATPSPQAHLRSTAHLLSAQVDIGKFAASVAKETLKRADKAHAEKERKLEAEIKVLQAKLATTPVPAVASAPKSIRAAPRTSNVTAMKPASAEHTAKSISSKTTLAKDRSDSKQVYMAKDRSAPKQVHDSRAAVRPVAAEFMVSKNNEATTAPDLGEGLQFMASMAEFAHSRKDSESRESMPTAGPSQVAHRRATQLDESPLAEDPSPLSKAQVHDSETPRSSEYEQATEVVVPTAPPQSDKQVKGGVFSMLFESIAQRFYNILTGPKAPTKPAAPAMKAKQVSLTHFAHQDISRTQIAANQDGLADVAIHDVWAKQEEEDASIVDSVKREDRALRVEAQTVGSARSSPAPYGFKNKAGSTHISDFWDHLADEDKSIERALERGGEDVTEYEKLVNLQDAKVAASVEEISGPLGMRLQISNQHPYSAGAIFGDDRLVDVNG